MPRAVERPITQGAALALAAAVSAALWGAAPGIVPPVPELSPWLPLAASAWCGLRADAYRQNRRRWRRWHTLPLWTLSPHALARQAGTDAYLIGQGFPWHPDNTRALLAWIDQYGLLPATADPRGGTPALHAVGAAADAPVRIPAVDLHSHLGIQGSSQSGKSALLRVCLSNAIRNTPGAVVLIDPKGGGDLLAHALVEAHHAQRPFALICPLFPELSRPFDPLSTCSSPLEVKERVRALMPHDTKSSPFFTNHPLTYLQRTATMMQSVGEAWTLPALYDYTLLPELRRRIAARYLVTLGAPATLDTTPPPSVEKIQSTYDALVCDDPIARRIMSDLGDTPKWLKETTSNLDASLSGIVDTDYTHLFTDRPALTWHEIDHQQMVVVISTASLLLRDASNKLGRLFLQDLMGYLGQRYLLSSVPDPAPITVIIDEVSEVLYDDFTQQVSKGGEAGARFILAWQSQADPEDKLGQARARVLFDNLQTRIWLRIADQQTAAEVSEGRGTCDVQRLGERRGMSYGSDHGVNMNTTRQPVVTKEPLIAPDWLPMLPQGEGFARIRGALYKFRVPLLPKPDPVLIARLGYGKLMRTFQPTSEGAA